MLSLRGAFWAVVLAAMVCGAPATGGAQSTTQSAASGEPGTAELSAAQQALGRGEYAKALDILEGVLKNQTDSQALIEAGRLLSEVLEKGREKLAEAKALATARKYPEAVAVLMDLAEQFVGTEVGRTAMAQLAALRSDDEAAKVLRLAVGAEDAEAIMARADALVARKQYAQAVDRYDLVASLYPRFADQAKEKVRLLLSDEQVARRIKEQRAARRAVGWLSIARNYAHIGRMEQARGFYEKVIRSYPHTSYARAARKELKGLVH